MSEARKGFEGMPGHDFLVETYAPLVYSVCRRILRRPDDVHDAAQEAILRIMRGQDSIRGSASGWVTSVARSCSVDLIRRSVRERRRREQLRGLPAAESMEQTLQWDTVRQRIGDALTALDESSRQLLIDRFFRDEPLAVIALRQNRSVSAVSRRVSAAVEDLTVILRDMGANPMTPGALSEWLETGGRAVETGVLGTDELRFAADWRAASLSPDLRKAARPLAPGWARPIRIGALVSQASMSARAERGIFRGCGHDPDVPLESLGWLQEGGFELVSIVEPGTTHIGQIERLLRDHALVGGLVSANDPVALRTLDVIVLGFNWAIHPQTAAALADAVKSGVGLLNEYWTGDAWAQQTNPHLRELSLASTPVVGFHVDNCGYGVQPATVREESPLLPGLKVGDRFGVVGCGPLYRPAAGAKVLIVKDLLIAPADHRIADAGAMQMPVYLTGLLGHGRVAVVNLIAQRSLLQQIAATPSEYFGRLMEWLADPRREELRA